VSYRFLLLPSSSDFNSYSRQISSSYLRIEQGFFVILALTAIASYYYIYSDRVSALTEDVYFINGYLEKDTAHISYYGSIFSNLSRGLPIVEGVPSTEPPNDEEDQQVSVNSTV